MHMAQALDSPDESEESLITNKVTAFSSDSPCRPISYTSHTRSTAEFRLKQKNRLLGGFFVLMRPLKDLAVLFFDLFYVAFKIFGQGIQGLVYCCDDS